MSRFTYDTQQLLSSRHNEHFPLARSLKSSLVGAVRSLDPANLPQLDVPCSCATFFNLNAILPTTSSTTVLQFHKPKALLEATIMSTIPGMHLPVGQGQNGGLSEQEQGMVKMVRLRPLI